MSDKKLKERSRERGFERKWISRLYDIFSNYVQKEFTISVDDELIEDYNTDDEDLVEIAKDLFT